MDIVCAGPFGSPRTGFLVHPSKIKHPKQMRSAEPLLTVCAGSRQLSFVQLPWPHDPGTTGCCTCSDFLLSYRFLVAARLLDHTRLLNGLLMMAHLSCEREVMIENATVTSDTSGSLHATESVMHSEINT